MRNPVTLDQLKQSFSQGTLGSITTFHTLGRYVKTELGGDRGKWGDQTLMKLGETLRNDIPGVFSKRDLSQLLQASVRIAKTFSVARIREVERKSRVGKFPLSVSHLGYIASACKSKELQDKWIDTCIEHKWNARQLQSELIKTFAGEPNSRSGKRYTTPATGILSIELAVKKLKRLFADEKRRQKWVALKSKEKAALENRLSKCLKALQGLEKIGR